MSNRVGRPSVLLLNGYFDWFGSYQETALAAHLPNYADTEIIACDRVAPIFGDDNLAKLGLPRRYQPGTRIEHGVTMTRFSTCEIRGMMWSTQVRRYIQSRQYDLIIQVVPGEVLPFAGTLAKNQSGRVALYGDNSAMWSHLSRGQRILKGAAFGVSKGVLYTLVNRRADAIFGYTPNTVSRLRFFTAGKPMGLLPLAYDPGKFHFDEHVRAARRREMGFTDSDIVVLAAGKVLALKRLDLLLDAFASLARTRPELRLVVAGADDGRCSAELRARVHNDPMLDRIATITAFLDSRELNAVFNAADIGVWPRLPAITIQQAMGTGLKVILPKNDWVGHLIRPGSGAYFSVSDSQGSRDIAEAISSQLDGRWGAGDRRRRAETNAWLGADRITESLLRTAGVLQ